MTKKVIMFPGQGAQKLGMGGDLFDKYGDLVNEADGVLGYSIKELCLEDEKSVLNHTAYTQPALYVVSALSFIDYCGGSIDKASELEVDCFIGHSLGEYNALFAAGVFDFITGLKLVRERGELMSKVSGGGMAAVIGLSHDKVTEILQASSVDDKVVVANDNSPEQVVISGLKESVQKLEETFMHAGCKKYVMLNVSGAFHSRYMTDTASHFKTFLDTFDFNAPADKTPVLANVNAQPYPGNAEGIKTLLSKQIHSAVLWTKTIRTLKKADECTFLELGSGKVLTGLARRITV